MLAKLEIQILLFILMILPMMTNAAGGAMAQDRSQSRSQDRSQNRSQARPQNKPHTEASQSGKWTGSLELVSGLGIGHLPNEEQDSDPMIHLQEQAIFTLSLD